MAVCAHACPTRCGKGWKEQQETSWKTTKLSFRETIKVGSQQPRLIAAKQKKNTSSAEGECGGAKNITAGHGQEPRGCGRRVGTHLLGTPKGHELGICQHDEMWQALLQHRVVDGNPWWAQKEGRL